MPLHKTSSTHYFAQLRLSEKGRAIKGLIACNSWDVSAFGPDKRFVHKLL